MRHPLVVVGDWVHHLFNDRSLQWSEKRMGQNPLAEVVDANGKRRFIGIDISQDDFLVGWHKVVSIYNGKNVVSRVPEGSCIIPGSGLLTTSVIEANRVFIINADLIKKL